MDVTHLEDVRIVAEVENDDACIRMDANKKTPQTNKSEGFLHVREIKNYNYDQYLTALSGV